MKAPRIRAVEMVRKIRDRQARRLAGKSPEEIIAFYRAAGEAAVYSRQRSRRYDASSSTTFRRPLSSRAIVRAMRFAPSAPSTFASIPELYKVRKTSSRPCSPVRPAIGKSDDRQGYKGFPPHPPTMIRLICLDMDGVLAVPRNFWMELHHVYGTEAEGKELTGKYLRTDYARLIQEVVGMIRAAIVEAAAKDSLHAALEVGYRAFGESACTAGACEWITAFLEKRKPDFERTG